MSSLSQPQHLKEDLKALLPLHIAKCKNKPLVSSSTSEPNLSSVLPSPSTDSSSKTVNFSVDANQSINEDTIIIQPNINRGSSANLVQNETTFPVAADFNSASIRFQFFVRSLLKWQLIINNYTVFL